MSLSYCTVSGTLTDLEGNPIVGATINATNLTPYFYGDGTLITAFTDNTSSGANGTWSIQLVETTSTQHTVVFEVVLPPGNSTAPRMSYTAMIPNTSTANFSAIAQLADLQS